MVTATYRDTQLMDTPIAITAVTDVEIEQNTLGWQGNQPALWRRAVVARAPMPHTPPEDVV